MAHARGGSDSGGRAEELPTLNRRRLLQPGRPDRWTPFDDFPPKNLPPRVYGKIIRELEGLGHFKAFREELDKAFGHHAPILRDSIMRACKLAACAHYNEPLRYSGLPYVTHVLAVATGLLRLKDFVVPHYVEQARLRAKRSQRRTFSEQEVARIAGNAAKISFHDDVIAALLHDSLENHELDVRDIERSFGFTIARKVSALTTPHLAMANFRSGAYGRLAGIENRIRKAREISLDGAGRARHPTPLSEDWGVDRVFRGRFHLRPPELVYPGNVSRHEQGISFDALALLVGDDNFERHYRAAKEAAVDLHIGAIVGRNDPGILLLKALDVCYNRLDDPKPNQKARYERVMPALFAAVLQRFPSLGPEKQLKARLGKAVWTDVAKS